jgi:NADH dehydrogenase
MGSLFITGFSGFIGSHLIRRINPRRYQKIYGLSRTQGSPIKGVLKNFQLVKGSIGDPESYASYLSSCDTVIHLAAATGKAAPEAYFSINAEGTRRLVEQCRQAGVKNFLYVSTIAVKYLDKRRYFYAQSKEMGEQAVRESSLNYAIVRPTIVIGKEAAIWQALSGLGRRRILFMPGDGKTRIQPIYIEDLINCLLMIVNEKLFSNEVFELGGPEAITFERLLKQIHRAYHGKEPSVIHLPLKLLTQALAFIESRLTAALPISVGQLSAFNNDGTIEMNRLFRRAAPQMKSINGMLREVVADE